MYGEGDSAVSDMGILQGDGVRIHCPRAGCLHTSHTVLELCDHINTDHQAQRAVLVQRLTGLKTCPCGALYVDTQVGKSAHHAWCDALAEGLASSAPILEGAQGSVVIQQILGISTVASDGTVVRLKAHALTAHDWGSTGSLHGVNHTNICFYLCCEAPATLPAAGTIAPVDMRERAIRRKQRLAPGATAIVIAANRQGADFGRADVMAYTEVSIETARGGKPLLIVDANLAPVHTALVADARTDPATPVTMLLRRGNHFKRLYAHQPMTLDAARELLRPNYLRQRAMTPAPVLASQILAWADEFVDLWAASGQAPPDPPDTSGARSGGHAARGRGRGRGTGRRSAQAGTAGDDTGEQEKGQQQRPLICCPMSPFGCAIADRNLQAIVDHANTHKHKFPDGGLLWTELVLQRSLRVVQCPCGDFYPNTQYGRDKHNKGGCQNNARASDPAGPPAGGLAGITTQAFQATMRGAEWMLGDRAFTSHNYGKHIKQVHTQADLYLACTVGDPDKATALLNTLAPAASAIARARDPLTRVNFSEPNTPPDDSVLMALAMLNGPVCVLDHSAVACDAVLWVAPDRDKGSITFLLRLLGQYHFLAGPATTIEQLRQEGTPTGPIRPGPGPKPRPPPSTPGHKRRGRPPSNNGPLSARPPAEPEVRPDARPGLHVDFDGGSRGNPGPGGAGALLTLVSEASATPLATSARARATSPRRTLRITSLSTRRSSMGWRWRWSSSPKALAGPTGSTSLCGVTLCRS